MIQHIMSIWSTPRLTNPFKCGAFAVFWLLPLLVLPGTTTAANARHSGGTDAVFFPGDTTISATICANETYLFDGQILDLPGDYTAVFTAPDGSDSTVTLQLTVLPLQTDTITASICAGETYPFFGLELDASGTYDAVLTGSNGCDSTVTLILTVLPTVSANASAAICSGSAYLFYGDTLTESGNYLAVLEASNGCDSLVHLKLDVVDFFDIHLSAGICQGESYLFGDTLLSAPGIYVDSLVAIGGCDSIVTLSLSLYPALLTQLHVGICDGTSYVFHGDTLSADGVYTYAETGAHGCDSIIILTLETVSSFETILEAGICNGETYTLGAQELTTSGVYTEKLTAIGGCDSTVTVTLTVFPTYSTVANVTICDGEPFEYDGQLLSDPGDYEFVLQSSNGCDSVVVLTLTVLEAPNTVLEAVICHGETFYFYGQNLGEDGVYEQVFEAANGCDSTISLILTVLPELITPVEAVVCAGETYDFNGDTLDQSGTYTQVLLSEFGCDSTVTVTLTVLPEQSTTLQQVICAGESYAFDGADLTDSGTYTAVFSDAHGCDSTVTLHLEVLPIKQSALEASICDGASYSFNGAALTVAGVYTAVLTGTFGCDSTVTLTLTVLPTHSTTIDATICEGSAYNYFGQLLTDSGAHEFGLTGINGCDSTVIVNITVTPLQYGSQDVEICGGESYEFNGASLTETGVYNFAFPGSNGCDSIFIVYLTVHPAYTTVLNVVQCTGSSYAFNGANLVVSGSYVAEYTSIYGCDSTVNLNLSFVNLFETALEATICQGEVFEFGADILTTNGVFTHVLPTASGCDSVVTLTLTVLPVSSSEKSATICAGASYAFNGASLTASGNYTATLTAANGCDSTVVLHLTVLPAANTEISATICANETYPFYGTTLHQTGVYTTTLTTINGCDSIITLHLTVLPPATGSSSATICAGESYAFNGQILTESGSYTTVYNTPAGCDSVVTLALTVVPLPQSAFAATVCNGQPFTFNGETFTQSGVYSFILDHAAVNGCDSMITLFLTIFPAVPPATVNVGICPGETYQINGLTLSAPGQYTFNLSSSTGCDSILTVNLTVLPTFASSLTVHICEGDTFTYQGLEFTEQGLYNFTYQSTNGCDSVLTLVVVVIEVNVVVTENNGTLTASSPDATFQWIDCANNQPISGATGSSFTPTVTGQYAVVVTNNAGCTTSSGCITVIVVSVEEPFFAANWDLQPNPARGHTMLVLSETLEQDVRMEIFDAAGRLLHQQEVLAGVNQVDIDLSGFPDGILAVRLIGEGGVSAKWLMKGD